MAASPNDWFSNRILGCFGIAVGIALLSAIGVAFMQVVGVLIHPAPFLEKYVATTGNLEAAMAVALEYESMTIRTQGLQVAFGILAGLVFVAAGLLLFSVGAAGTLRVTGTAEATRWSLTTAAPGLAVLILGGLLISLAVGKSVHSSFEASLSQGKNVIVPGQELPRSSRKGVNGQGNESPH
jgi:hypothetical protein